MAHKRKPELLWTITAIGALSNGERRVMKFVVAAQNSTDAITKIDELTRDYILYDYGNHKEVQWKLEQVEANEVPLGVYCVEGIESFEVVGG